MTDEDEENRIRDERGQAMTEFAIVLPILIVLLFGIVQFGILFNNYVTLTDAVRAGARAAAVSRQSAESPGNCNRCSPARPQAVSTRANLGVNVTSAWTPGAHGDGDGDVSVFDQPARLGRHLGKPLHQSRRRQSNDQQAGERPGNGADGSVSRGPARDGGTRARRRLVVPREAPAPARQPTQRRSPARRRCPEVLRPPRRSRFQYAQTNGRPRDGERRHDHKRSQLERFDHGRRQVERARASSASSSESTRSTSGRLRPRARGSPRRRCMSHRWS